MLYSSSDIIQCGTSPEPCTGYVSPLLDVTRSALHAIWWPDVVTSGLGPESAACDSYYRQKRCDTCIDMLGGLQAALQRSKPGLCHAALAGPPGTTQQLRKLTWCCS